MQLDNSYANLPAHFHRPVVPEAAEAPRLLAWNDELADALGLANFGGTAEERARIFGGGPLPTQFEPIALAYAGHQFGAFNPQLGDGRAALLGEVLSPSGERYDLQLKGSGRTPFSRGGDGRSWLGPVLREYIVSEAMHRLGVPTSRALAAVATGRTVYREAPLPGAVFTRVAASHIRIGTFEYLAARDDREGLRKLADYAINRHYPHAENAAEPHAAFFRDVAKRQAELVAQWMAVGFIHGVMNTDNVSIAGETIDYGPCAFMDEFRFDKVFSSIDRGGRYSYANQPRIAHWNLARLAECLLRIDVPREALEDALDEFPGHYQAAWLAAMRPKLGLLNESEDDERLIGEWLQHLEDNELDYTLSFRQLAARLDADGTPDAGDLETRWRQRVLRQDATRSQVAAAMNAVNPLFIPRNHRIEEAIRDALEGSTRVFDELNAVLATPFSENAALAHYATAPQIGERVAQTFCGT